MKSTHPLFLPLFSTSDEEHLSSSARPKSRRWAIARATLYTAFTSIMVLITLFYGQFRVANLSDFFSAHLVLLILFSVGSLIITITQRSFIDETLFLFIILNALFLGYYSYLMTIYYFSALFPAYIQIIAGIIALGSAFLLFIGFALVSR